MLFNTKFLENAPGPEDIVAGIISEAAKGVAWVFHAKNWLRRVCDERLKANGMQPDYKRRMEEWQNCAA
eukprot:4336678-Heterocapsa_arctica.AAC.1